MEQDVELLLKPWCEAFRLGDWREYAGGQQFVVSDVSFCLAVSADHPGHILIRLDGGPLVEDSTPMYLHDLLVRSFVDFIGGGYFSVCAATRRVVYSDLLLAKAATVESFSHRLASLAAHARDLPGWQSSGDDALPRSAGPVDLALSTR